MAATYDVYLEPTYSAIHVIFESAPGAQTMELYYNNVLEGTFVAVPPVPDDPDDGIYNTPLIFVNTSTSTTFKHIFTFTPADIDMADGFKDGLYHMVFPDDTFGVNGVIVDKEIKCCMAKKLTDAQQDCGTSSTLAEINEVHAFLVASDAAIRSGSPELAMCGINAIGSYCEDSCCDE